MDPQSSASHNSYPVFCSSTLEFVQTTAKEFLDLLEKPNKDVAKMDETLHVKSSLAGSN